MVESIPTYRTEHGEEFFCVEDACDALKLHFPNEIKRTRKTVFLSEKIKLNSDGRHLLPDICLFGWIAGVQSEREDIIAYKKECALVLQEALKGGDMFRNLFGNAPSKN